MREEPNQARLLIRHFLRGLVENDLVSPGEDLHAPIAAIVAALVSLSGGVCAIFLMKYNPPKPIPLDEKLAMAVDDKVLLLGCAMVIMALVTLLAWDSLSLDRRDIAFVGPLPIRASTLLLSKTTAIAALALTFGAALSVPPAAMFPVVMLGSASVGLVYALGSMGAQALAGFLGCTFVFLALVALRGLATLTLPGAVARRALLGIQCVLIPVLFAALLLMPQLAMLTRPAIEGQSAAALACPPLWFLGINDVLVGRADPVLRDLARVGAVAVAGTALLACATYLLAFRRDLVRFRGPALAPRAGEKGRAWLRGVMPLMVSDPLARGSWAFTVATLTRSPQHRLHLVGYLGAGVALACGSLGAAYGRMDAAILDLTPVTLAVQFNLLFFLLAGVRVAATLPADLQAAWLFRFRASESLSRHLAGTRSAVFFLGVVPLLLLLLPAHAMLWGWYTAAVHAAWGFGFATVLWVVLFWRFDRLPFACAATPGRARLTNRLWLYLVGYYAVVYLPAWAESFLLGRRELAVAWAALALACGARL
ncbi:MAG: hypothetical protein EHM24_29675, partial [Acidobacteria bacterium]